MACGRGGAPEAATSLGHAARRAADSNGLLARWPAAGSRSARWGSCRHGRAPAAGRATRGGGLQGGQAPLGESRLRSAENHEHELQEAILYLKDGYV